MINKWGEIINHIVEGGKEYEVAITPSGDQHWYLGNKRHREYGAAITHKNGARYYFYDGKELDVKNHEEFLRLMKIKAFL